MTACATQTLDRIMPRVVAEASCHLTIVHVNMFSERDKERKREGGRDRENEKVRGRENEEGMSE